MPQALRYAIGVALLKIKRGKVGSAIANHRLPIATNTSTDASDFFDDLNPFIRM
ncbi:MAG: hypothetical protein V7K25_30870 [Nostoc sp.]|uniref:hypothetical protein n=1 Tax=Nostoc sp. TaxID=1180 RepID=UPI002FFBC421